MSNFFVSYIIVIGMSVLNVQAESSNDSNNIQAIGKMNVR